MLFYPLEARRKFLINARDIDGLIIKNFIGKWSSIDSKISQSLKNTICYNL